MVPYVSKKSAVESVNTQVGEVVLTSADIPYSTEGPTTVQQVLDSQSDQIATKPGYDYVDNVQENLNTEATARQAADENLTDTINNGLSSRVTYSDMTEALTDKVDRVVYEGTISEIWDGIDGKADQLALTMHVADTDVHGLDGVRSSITTGLAGKLNLTGGTLSGALNGTTAAFSTSFGFDTSYYFYKANSFTFAAQIGGGRFSIYNGATEKSYFDGNGNFQATGTVAATSFVGGGSGITGLTATQVGAYSTAQTDALLAAKAPLASPALTGTPTTPTATAGTNTTQIASTAFVTGAISTASSTLTSALTAYVKADGSVPITGNLTFTYSGSTYSTLQRGSGSSVYWDLPNGLTLNASSVGVNGTLYANSFSSSGGLTAATGTFSGLLQAGSLKVNATTYQSSGELNCGAGSYSDPLNGVLMDAKFGSNGIAVGGRSFLRNRVIINSATDDGTNQLQVTGPALFTSSVTASSFTGSGAALTGLTASQVGLGNVLNVASYSKAETDAYATSVTSQLASKLNISGGTVSQNSTGVPLTVTQSASWSGSNYALVVNGYTNLGGFRINAGDFPNSLYAANGGSLGISVNNGQAIVFNNHLYGERARIHTNGNFGIGTATPQYGLDVAVTARMNNSLWVNGDVNLNESGGFVGNYGPNGMTGLFVRGTENSEVVSLFVRDSEALYIQDSQIYMGLDVAMGYAYAGSFSTGYVDCYGGAYFAGSVSLDSGLYVSGIATFTDNATFGNAKVLVGRENSGVFGGIWFGGATANPSTSNYGFLFDHTTNGTLLNAVSGGYFQFRIGNDYANGITFSAAKNLVVGGSYNDAGNAKLDVRGNAIVTGVLTADGSGLTKVPSVRSVSVESPTGTENLTLFYCDKAMVITKLSAVLVGGSSPSVTWTLRYGSDRSGTGTEVVTGGTTTTSTTTGSQVTTFNSGTVPAGSWLWLKTTAASGSPGAMTVTITT